jgi:hypothetical protein
VDILNPSLCTISLPYLFCFLGVSLSCSWFSDDSRFCGSFFMQPAMMRGAYAVRGRCVPIFETLLPTTMTKVKLAFDNLQQLAECMLMLSLRRPHINYDERTLTTLLTDKQMHELADCRCRVLMAEPIEMKTPQEGHNAS